MDAQEIVFPLRYWIVAWYSIIFIMGSIGNCIVLIVIMKSKNVQKSSSFNCFIFTLALSDLLISILGLLNYILSTMTFDHPTKDWADNLCRFYSGYFLSFWLMKVSTYLLVAISLDRRKVIIDPLSTLNKRPFKKTALIIFGIFCIAFCDELPIIIGLRYNENKPTVGNSCSFIYTRLQAISIYIALFIVQTLTPIIAVCFSFIQVRNELLKTNENVKTLLTSTYQDETVINKKLTIALRQKVKTIETMRILAIVFFVCVFPHDFFYVLFQFADVKSLSWNSWPYQMAMLLRFSNSLVNPLLYSFHSERFRKNFHEVFRSRVQNKTFEIKRAPKQNGYSRIINQEEKLCVYL